MFSRQRGFTSCLALAAALSASASSSAFAGESIVQAIDNIGESITAPFVPGTLVLSRSVYTANPDIITPGVTQLPPNCTGANCVTATANGAYPFVFNNALVDGSFGVTSKIFLDQMLPEGIVISSLEVPNSQQPGVSTTANQMVTSFSSKSELALNVSTDGRFITFMGYLAPIGAIDVSNANTPAVVDPTNPVPGTTFRLVAQVDSFGRFHFTETNAYSGNNGRAAVLNHTPNGDLVYMAGNAGNGANPQPVGVITGAGAQILTASNLPVASQSPGLPTPVGSFSITELGDKADKVGKDTNFRGLTIFNNVLYTTKGSGSNGVNTLYFIDTSGFNGNNPAACPNGVGLPKPQAALPTSPINFVASTVQANGVTPFNMCILKGFPTTLAKTSTAFPFGVWFANATTVYVADEGNGTATFDTTTGQFSAAAEQTTAGLQKWVFNGASGSWQLAYTLTAGLNLGAPYTVRGYPTGINAATGLPWSPATDGLRNLTGHVNADGTVTIWAITSTVSGSGDQGADPNKLVAITDSLGATTLPASESFKTVRTAEFGEVLRGVSFSPTVANIPVR